VPVVRCRDPELYEGFELIEPEALRAERPVLYRYFETNVLAVVNCHQEYFVTVYEIALPERIKYLPTRSWCV